MTVLVLLVLLALLAVLAVLAWAPGRPAPRQVRAGPRRTPGWPPRLPGRRRPRPPDLAAAVTEVASRLRTGVTPADAWATTVERLLGPAPPVEAPAQDGVPPGLARLVAACSAEPSAAAAARTVVAASRLTHTLGAPLAEVLERCAATVTEAEQASDARRVALAGPRSTARILAGLPLLGLLLGAGLGADPLGSATDGGWGSVSVVLGLLLLLAGRRWTAALVGAAQRGGTASR